MGFSTIWWCHTIYLNLHFHWPSYCCGKKDPYIKYQYLKNFAPCIKLLIVILQEFSNKQSISLIITILLFLIDTTRLPKQLFFSLSFKTCCTVSPKCYIMMSEVLSIINWKGLEKLLKTATKRIWDSNAILESGKAVWYSALEKGNWIGTRKCILNNSWHGKANRKIVLHVLKYQVQWVIQWYFGRVCWI